MVAYFYEMLKREFQKLNIPVKELPNNNSFTVIQAITIRGEEYPIVIECRPLTTCVAI